MNLRRSQPTGKRADRDAANVSGKQRGVLYLCFLWGGKRKVVVGKKRTYRERWVSVKMWCSFCIRGNWRDQDFPTACKDKGIGKTKASEITNTIKKCIRDDCPPFFQNTRMEDHPTRILSSHYKTNVEKLRYFYLKCVINFGTLWLKLLLKPEVKRD